MSTKRGLVTNHTDSSLIGSFIELLPLEDSLLDKGLVKQMNWGVKKGLECDYLVITSNGDRERLKLPAIPKGWVLALD